MKPYYSLFAILCIALMRCGSESSLTGGSETTNGVITIAEISSVRCIGTPRQRLFLYSEDYDPRTHMGFSDSMFMPASGRVKFANLDSGFYNLIVHDTSGQEGLIVPLIPVFKGVKVRDTSFMDSSGTISATVIVGDSPKSDVACYILGTGFIDSTDASGAFTLKGIPKGTYDLSFFYLRKTGSKTTTAMYENVFREISVNGTQRKHVIYLD